MTRDSMLYMYIGNAKTSDNTDANSLGYPIIVFLVSKTCGLKHIYVYSVQSNLC